MDVVAIGETMLALDPDKMGRLRSVETFHRFAGGAETNSLIGLQRLGYQTRWISLLGDDEFGRYILSTIRGEGVDISGVRVVSDACTGVFFIERKMFEDCTSLYYRDTSAMRYLSTSDVDEWMITDAKILLLTGITPLLSETCLAATLKLIGIARMRGIKIALDPNLRLKLFSVEAARAVLIPIMQSSHIVLPNMEELKLLYPDKGVDEIASELLAAGVEIVVIKQGEHGAAAYTRQGMFSTQAYQIKNIVSTMGAGDAFNAGFLAGVLDSKDIQTSLGMGTAMAAFVVMGADSYQMLPSRGELEDLISGRKGGFVR